ncbi:DUF3630 family protein [Pseudoalteromonas luteoviolacea]|uniref:DUF3630 domain-containing protein n=1 Tax=Pseudoalteromonas luteoviolacea S4054 TaxID=1129367 RepID=A0A0F6A5P3_9GAMM|nr:DUF3630 family protein [Pseudoalteromonas luteoviolacea]AOT07129.1 hypothetical protein S4054249_04280 [Pseudoalteromonas luteoviolacea]AOT12046.1 hypothetical protein S40542_04280 [Pseudoalteromonas luteoviolacea]AOT16959.1 hypothetical protein S4054_04280 [Pseudoalteromonas luteoviolacea]KKE81522.1 hypothetical protein N479_22225 [Pseudoalteromonas luteoviolacea S4054]KZN70036.1 hypothetical protein N481_21725 [Pseudoalteromonas luteoviolacea S4047-1]
MTKIISLDEQDALQIIPSEFPDGDDFQLWGSVFLSVDKLETLEFNEGADRHQWRFTYLQQPFSLNFEHYSESIWICPEGQESLQLLSSLHALFCSNLQQ